MAYFNEQYYLAQNADVQSAVNQGFFSSGLQHYQLFGGSEVRNPSAILNAAYYLSSNADVQAAVTAGTFRTPLDHFDQFGVTENRAPNSTVLGFDAARYLAENADVQAAVAAGVFFSSALDHYLEFGAAESRPAFTTGGATIAGNSGDPLTLTSTGTVNEGGTVTFTLQTTNVAAGTQFGYTITGVSAADVQGGMLTGNATIGTNGQAQIQVTLVADTLTEGVETLTLTVDSRSTSASVNDTSTGAGAGQTLTLTTPHHTL